MFVGELVETARDIMRSKGLNEYEEIRPEHLREAAAVIDARDGLMRRKRNKVLFARGYHRGFETEENAFAASVSGGELGFECCNINNQRFTPPPAKGNLYTDLRLFVGEREIHPWPMTTLGFQR